MTNPSRKGAETICQLQANQIMSSPVQTVYEGWSIKRLMKFLLEAGISGAPVTASDGSVVGVVSVSDVVRFENLGQQDKLNVARLECYNEYVGHQLPESDLKSLLDHADQHCTVNAIMTPTVFAVELNTPLPEIAELMREHNIHRVFVQDDLKRVVGVVSTSNILQVIAQMCDCSL